MSTGGVCNGLTTSTAGTPSVSDLCFYSSTSSALRMQYNTANGLYIADGLTVNGAATLSSTLTVASATRIFTTPASIASNITNTLTIGEAGTLGGALSQLVLSGHNNSASSQSWTMSTGGVCNGLTTSTAGTPSVSDLCFYSSTPTALRMQYNTTNGLYIAGAATCTGLISTGGMTFDTVGSALTPTQPNGITNAPNTFAGGLVVNATTVYSAGTLNNVLVARTFLNNVNSSGYTYYEAPGVGIGIANPVANLHIVGNTIGDTKRIGTSWLTTYTSSSSGMIIEGNPAQLTISSGNNDSTGSYLNLVSNSGNAIFHNWAVVRTTSTNLSCNNGITLTAGGNLHGPSNGLRMDMDSGGNMRTGIHNLATASRLRLPPSAFAGSTFTSTLNSGVRTVACSYTGSTMVCNGTVTITYPNANTTYGVENAFQNNYGAVSSTPWTTTAMFSASSGACTSPVTFTDSQYSLYTHNGDNEPLSLVSYQSPTTMSISSGYWFTITFPSAVMIGNMDALASSSAPSVLAKTPKQFQVYCKFRTSGVERGWVLCYDSASAASNLSGYSLSSAQFTRTTNLTGHGATGYTNMFYDAVTYLFVFTSIWGDGSTSGSTSLSLQDLTLWAILPQMNHLCTTAPSAFPMGIEAMTSSNLAFNLLNTRSIISSVAPIPSASTRDDVIYINTNATASYTAYLPPINTINYTRMFIVVNIGLFAPFTVTLATITNDSFVLSGASTTTLSISTANKSILILADITNTPKVYRVLS